MDCTGPSALFSCFRVDSSRPGTGSGSSDRVHQGQFRFVGFSKFCCPLHRGHSLSRYPHSSLYGSNSVVECQLPKLNVD